jgi:hypothetical protein
MGKHSAAIPHLARSIVVIQYPSRFDLIPIEPKKSFADPPALTIISVIAQLTLCRLFQHHSGTDFANLGI